MAKVWLDHADLDVCRCEVIDGEIFVRPPCRVEGEQRTKSRLQQLVHSVQERQKERAAMKAKKKEEGA